MYATQPFSPMHNSPHDCALLPSASTDAIMVPVPLVLKTGP